MEYILIGIFIAIGIYIAPIVVGLVVFIGAFVLVGIVLLFDFIRDLFKRWKMFKILDEVCTPKRGTKYSAYVDLLS